MNLTELKSQLKNIRGLKMFEKFRNTCLDSKRVVLRYSDFTVNGAILNLTDYRQRYESLRNVSWFCKGICRFRDYSLDISMHGCMKG